MNKRLKVTAISDTHTHHDELKLPGGDILIHAGDISYFGQVEEVRDFLYWFASQKYDHKIFIAGNHDFGFEPRCKYTRCHDGFFMFRGKVLEKGLEDKFRAFAKELGIIYLDKEYTIVENYKIYGIPDTPWFHDWAFNYRKDSEHAQYIFSRIPEDTDILVTHGPAYGVLDKHRPTEWYNRRTGCEVLREHVLRVKPLYHIFGHIHESHGRKKKYGINFINASFCGIPYENFNKPVNFYLPRRENETRRTKLSSVKTKKEKTGE